MGDNPKPAGQFDSVADFYAEQAESEPLINALLIWDQDEFRPLQVQDPELYGLICRQLGYEIDILLGKGTVKLGLDRRRITLTWNGDEEDLLDLVLEGAPLISED